MANMQEKGLYEILQVHESAHVDVIQAAYRRLSLLYHPDRNASSEASEMMAELNNAYEILSDPLRRRAYDRIRNAQGEQETNEPAYPTEARWNVSRDVDPLTQKRRVFAEVRSEGDSNQYLMIMTERKKLRIMVAFGEEITFDYGKRVQYRIGNKKIQEEFWGTSADGESVFVPEKKTNSFMKDMLKAQELVLRVITDYGVPSTAVFQLHGLAEAWQELRTTFEGR